MNFLDSVTLQWMKDDSTIDSKDSSQPYFQYMQFSRGLAKQLKQNE